MPSDWDAGVITAQFYWTASRHLDQRRDVAARGAGVGRQRDARPGVLDGDRRQRRPQRDGAPDADQPRDDRHQRHRRTGGGRLRPVPGQPPAVRLGRHAGRGRQPHRRDDRLHAGRRP